MIDFLSNIFEHFSDPRKRVFLGYIFLSIVISILWLLKTKRLSFKQALKYIFNGKILLSTSSKSDIKLFLINRVFVLFVSPLLVTQLAIATLIYHFLKSLDWLDVGMFSDTPKSFIIFSFTAFIFILDDFTKFIIHRWMHKWPILWSLHKVHHSATTLTPLTIYRTHPLEGVIFTLRGSFTQGISISTFVFFFGNNVDLITIIGVNIFVFCFNVAGANLRHSHIGIQYWKWLEYILISPAQHQLHHSVAQEHYDKNFGATLAIWDWIFGSLNHSENTETLSLGVRNNEILAPHNLYTLYIMPITEIFVIIQHKMKYLSEFFKQKLIKIKYETKE